jgi:hypothetical protein
MNTTNVSQALALRSTCLLVFLFTATNSAMSQEIGTNTPQLAANQEGVIRETARLRAFGQNGVSVEFYQNSVCVGGNAQKTKVSGGAGDAFSSFIGTIKNTSLGMKETPNTENLSKRGGIASKAYFREYEIRANQPVSLSMHFGDMNGGSCGSIGGTFTPETGKDYEIALNWRANYCLVSVQEIQQDEQGKVTMQDVPTTPTSKCK